MSLVVWFMMGIAVWHFTVFVPDRFWGGIVGAFLVSALVSAVLFGFIVNGATVPGANDTDLIQALIADPGSADRPRGVVPLGRAHGPRVTAWITASRAPARTSSGNRPGRGPPGRSGGLSARRPRMQRRARDRPIVEWMLAQRVKPLAPEVSVVVATHNRALRLTQLLAGLREQTLARRPLRGHRRGRRLLGRHAARARPGGAAR